MPSTPPTDYSRQTSFAGFSAQNPTGQHSGTLMDAEFNALKIVLDQISARLAEIQRDDGEVANDTVGRDALKAEVAAGVNPPTAWVAATDYTERDTVIVSGVWYWCNTAHTSGATFATTNWTVIIDLFTLVNLGFSVSAFAQTLLDDTTAGAMLTTLGFSAYVQGLLNNASAADFLTDLGLSVSAFAKTLIDDADAAASMTTLGMAAFFQTLVSAGSALAFRALIGVPYLDASGHLVVGASASVNSGGHAGGFGQSQAQFHGSSGLHGIATFRYGSGVHGAAVLMHTAEGSVGAPTNVASGAGLGQLVATGHFGGSWYDAGRIAFKVDGTPGAQDMPGRIEVYTTPDGGYESVFRGHLADSSGRIVWGHTAAVATPGASTEPLVQVIGGGNNRAVVQLAEYQASFGGIGPSVTFARSKTATKGGQGIVADADSLGGLHWSASDGITQIGAAFITAQVNGTPGVNDMPAALVFGTTADGAASATARAAVFPDGTLGPWADDVYDLGKTSNRWDDVYATNGTIQTSDISEKRDIDALTLGLDFVCSLDTIQFRWKDVDQAAVTEKRTVRRPKLEAYTKAETQTVVDVVNGKAVRRTVRSEVQKTRPVVTKLPVFDERGRAVFEERPVYETLKMRDEVTGRTVERQVATSYEKVAVIHEEPVFEDVEVEVELAPARKKTHARLHLGIDARQMKSVLDEVGIDAGLVTVDLDTGRFGWRPGEMIPVLIKALQEEAVAREEQGAMIAALAARLASVEAGRGA